MNTWSLLALALLLGSGVVLAAEPRTDRNGDPLPEGAVARLGNGRLLHGGVRHVEFSPDGKWLATSGSEGARLWDAATGKEVLPALVPRSGLAVLTFTPDGVLVVGDEEGCRVIDPATTRVRCFWTNALSRPRAVAVAADGKSAATAWEEGGVTVHDLAGDGKRPGRKLSDDEAELPTLSGDGGLLAYVKDKAVLLWDVRQRKLLHTHALPEKNDRVHSLCLSRDGGRLAAARDDRLVLWDTATHAEVKGFAGPQETAVFLRFSPDGAELVGVSNDRDVVRWSAATGQELARSSPQGDAKGRCWHSALSPDGRSLATVWDRTVRLWDASSWKELVAVERGRKSWRDAVFVRPGVVATYTGQGEPDVIAFWDATDGRPLHKHTLAVPHEGWWRRALSPDGKLFAAPSDPTGVVIYDVESGKEVQRLKPPSHEDEGTKFDFSPDGKTIVTTYSPKGLMLWDVATGKSLRELAGDHSGAMAFAPDGRSVASAFVGRFYLTEVASGKARQRLALPESQEREQAESAVDRIRFARNGRSVAAISRCDIHVFSTDRGTTLFHLYFPDRGNSTDETGALSADGRWLAHANSNEPDISVRDLQSPGAAAECQTLTGHAGGIVALEFSPDGKYLVSCGEDGTALVWDATRLTGKPEARKASRPAFDAADAETQWDELADARPRRAGRAMGVLVEFPDVAVPVLKARLKLAEAPPTGQVERLIADLDSDTPAVRQKASEGLKGLAELAEPALRKALEGKPSPEVARRAKELLEELDKPVTDPERLRQLRAVEVLERIGTAEARQVLEALAKGAPAARLTQEAKASLDRLSAR